MNKAEALETVRRTLRRRVAGIPIFSYPMFLGGSRGADVSSVREDSDWDVLVDVSGEANIQHLIKSLEDAGFVKDGIGDADYLGSCFNSFKHPNGVNALLYFTNEGWRMSKLATEIIKAFNLTKREDRIVVNQILRDHVVTEDLEITPTNVGELLG